MMKKIFPIIFLLVVLLIIGLIVSQGNQKFPPLNGSILILNQVRGDECCQQGSVDFLLGQVNDLKKSNLPAGFLFRYDALLNRQMVDMVRSYDKATPGLFFEITPQTAKSAGVIYKSSSDQWFRPQNALLLGYSQEERKKLIDELCRKFQIVFGKYPLIAGSWMIDSWSLQYLSETYGVRLFEITKEQYGTDSYVLYGGVENQPYIPSRDWAFIPGNSSNSLNMIMVRQTISDPLYNYGDVSSSYTSQPNDYMIRKQNITYFTHLIKQAMTGLPTGFALIGLENSMEQKYQDEYAKQIETVERLTREQNVKVISPTSLIEQKLKAQNQMSIYRGVDFKNSQREAFWVNGLTYRVRFIKEKNKLRITDIRGYSSDIKDPYFGIQKIVKSAFWETPSLIDASKSIKNDSSLYFQKTPVKNDFSAQTESLVLPELQSGDIVLERKNDSYITTYNSPNKNKVQITYGKKGIIFNFSSAVEKKATLDQIELFIKNHSNIFSLADNKNLVFTLSPNLSYRMNSAPQIEYLEKAKETTFNPTNYTILYNADKVFLGRNPARIIMRPKQEVGSIMDKTKITVVSSNDSSFTYTITDVEGHLGASLGMYYVDIISPNPGFHSYSIMVSGQEIKLKDILFAVDCKKEKTRCVKNPISLFHYILVKIGDIWEKR